MAHPTEAATYELKKDGPGCTGMFFRKSPLGTKGNGGPLSSNWPRDGALLAGTVVTSSDDSQWLKCNFVQQKGQTEWEVVTNGFMPFRHQQYFLEKCE